MRRGKRAAAPGFVDFVLQPRLAHVRLVGIADEPAVRRLLHQVPAGTRRDCALLLDAAELTGMTREARAELTRGLSRTSLAAVAVTRASLRTRTTLAFAAAASDILRGAGAAGVAPLRIAFFDDDAAALGWLEGELAAAGATARDLHASTPPAVPLPWHGPHTSESAALTQHGIAWAEARGLLPSSALSSWLEAADVGGVAAVFAGAKPGMAELVAETATWLALQRDSLDRAARAGVPGALARSLVAAAAVLDGAELPSCAAPSLLALADLRRRLLERSDETWLERFRASMSRYWLGGVLEETRAARSGRAPLSLDSWLAIRTESVCVQPLLKLADPSYGVRLYETDSDDLLVLDVRRLAVFVSVIALELPTSAAAHEGPSMLTVLMNQGRSRVDAEAAIRDAHAELVGELERAAAQLAARGSDVRAWAEAHLRWTRLAVTRPAGDPPRRAARGGAARASSL